MKLVLKMAGNWLKTYADVSFKVTVCTRGEGL